MILLKKENTDDPVRRTEMGKAMYVSFGVKCGFQTSRKAKS